MANLSFKIRPNIIQGANLSAQHSSDKDVFIEYNNYYPAGHNVSAYRIEAQLALTNVTVNDDLSIDFDFAGIEKVRAYSRFSTAPVGYTVTKTLYRGDGTIAWKSTDDIAASFESGHVTVTKGTPKHYHVPANGTISIPEIKAFGWHCTGVVADQCDVYVGGSVSNIIPTYKPNGIYTGSWKSVQELALSNFVYQNRWIDVGTEQVATKGQSNKGHTRRFQADAWKQEGTFKGGQ